MPALRRVAIVLLLALFGWMAASVSDNFCTTADEIAHLTAGYDYWANAAYNLQPENGNFPQRWAATPPRGSAPGSPRAAARRNRGRGFPGSGCRGRASR